MLLGARRNRAHFFRWFYSGWILLQVCFLLFVESMKASYMAPQYRAEIFAEFCRNYLEVLLTQHYLVMLLATPVLAAGAITDEKSRGTLQYLLVTELYPWEILLGKLIGRLYQVFLIALAPLPWIGMLGPFGGLDLLTLLALGVASLTMAFALGSMSLLASVLCRQTRDAVLGLYCVGFLFYLGGAALLRWLSTYFGAASSIWLRWLETSLSCLDPLHPMGEGWSLDDTAERGRQLAASVSAWGTVGLVAFGLAVWKLRSSYLRYLEHTGKKRWWPVVAVFAVAWSALGLVVLLVYLVSTGQANAYLDGTGKQPWLRGLLLFLLAWNTLGLAPLLIAIVVLTLKGRSHTALTALHALLARNWLTRRAALTNDPLRWKERNVEGVAPLAMLRAMPRWLGVALIVLITSLSSIVILADHLAVQDTPAAVIKAILAADFDKLTLIHERMTSSATGFYSQGLVVMLLATLVVAIRCSGAVTGEREKSTWEALLLTPLETHQLIRGKLWGIIGASIPYLTAYVLPALFFAVIGGVGSVLWVVVWAAVTLLAMIFVGAAGLWCSVRAKTSWRSLLGTLGITYVGGFILFCVTSPIMIMMAMILFIFVMIVEQYLGFGTSRAFTSNFFNIFSLAMCVTLAGAFALMAWRFVAAAEYRVGVMERTKHWRNEPKHPRWSRHARELREKARSEPSPDPWRS
jgi:ABC-type transport system involved in multi-copper enzyme maturation permease subunit